MYCVPCAARRQLLRDETVYFAGYKLPHPLVQDMIVKVQTRDAPASPTEAMRTAIKDLQDEFSTFEELFNVSAACPAARALSSPIDSRADQPARRPCLLPPPPVCCRRV